MSKKRINEPSPLIQAMRWSKEVSPLILAMRYSDKSGLKPAKGAK